MDHIDEHANESVQEHAEHAEHAGEAFLEEFLYLLTSPGHWAFEVTGEVASSLIAYPFIRMAVRVWVARHDAKAHTPKATTNSNTLMAEEANA